MEYNTTRSKMLMPEYGRNVQKMVEHLLTITDREKRLRNAEVLIELMGTLNPHLKTIEDYKHKLWDHLFQMTDLQLDVDGPYTAPTREELEARPDPLPYPQKSIKHRHLGKNLDALMQKGLEEKDEEKRQGFTQCVGYYMKLAYTNWHKEPIHDDMIKNELAELTDGVMQYETGGYRVHFDNRTANNFKHNKGNNNNNNRNFKNASGNRNSHGNRDNRDNQGGNRDRNFGNRDNRDNQGGNYGGYNKNRKFKNKNKNNNN